MWFSERQQGKAIVDWVTLTTNTYSPTYKVGKPAEPAAPSILVLMGDKRQTQKNPTIKIIHLFPLFIDVERMSILQRSFDELIQTNSHLQHVLAEACGTAVETTLSAFLFSCPFMWQRS